MSKARPWDRIMSDADRALYAAAGFGGPSGLGEKPALLVIDMQYRTTGTSPRPLPQALDEFPTSCGELAWAAADKVVTLLATFRAKGWPVLYPHVAAKVASETGRLAAKSGAMWTVPPLGYEFLACIAPREGDVLVPKKHPSAFFGTSLVSHLVDLKVDTLVMVGCTTSGCVRASVVDAFSYNYRVVVPQDCVYDRSETSHLASLFDMAQKYADVMESQELIRALQDLPAEPIPT